ncbi:MAG: AAA family ATPase [Patescibacteria group bacterium]|nr:AAA family ATPase [Patescibacteria group bacterium]
MKVKKIVIGVCGANGSGKDTACDYLVEKYGAKKLVFSDLLKQALLIFISEIGRKDYAWLSTILRKRFGDGILSHGMKKKIERARTDLIVIAGVRDFGELEMIKSYEKGFFIFVDADIEIRWKRIHKRNIKADDRVSFEEFKREMEQLASERYIDKLKRKADFLIKNNGSLEALRKQLDSVMKKIK